VEVEDEVLVVVGAVGRLADVGVSRLGADVHPDDRVDVEPGQLLRLNDRHSHLPPNATHPPLQLAFVLFYRVHFSSSTSGGSGRANNPAMTTSTGLYPAAKILHGLMGIGQFTLYIRLILHDGSAPDPTTPRSPSSIKGR